MFALFTFCFSWIVSYTAMRHPSVVIEAIALTAAVTIAIICYASTTKNDFKPYGQAQFWIVGWIFVTMCIFAWPLGYGWNGSLTWCGIGAFLFSFYLLIDTQLIMRGVPTSCLTCCVASEVECNGRGYILAVVMLYLDMINIFCYILSLLGSKK